MMLKKILPKTKIILIWNQDASISCEAFKTQYCKCDSRIVEGHRWCELDCILCNAEKEPWEKNSSAIKIMMEIKWQKEL